MKNVGDHRTLVSRMSTKGFVSFEGSLACNASQVSFRKLEDLAWMRTVNVVNSISWSYSPKPQPHVQSLQYRDESVTSSRIWHLGLSVRMGVMGGLAIGANEFLSCEVDSVRRTSVEQSQIGVSSYKV